MSIKFDLVELSRDRMKDVTAGVWIDTSCWKDLRFNDLIDKICGCACAGPSSTEDNSDANYFEGKRSPC